MSRRSNQTQVKTENRSTTTSQIYPRIQDNNYRLTYTSKSPSKYYSKTKKEKDDNQKNNSNLGRYSQQQRFTNIEKNVAKSSYNINQYKRNNEKIEKNKKLPEDKSFQLSKKNTNHSIYVSDSSNVKNNTGKEKKYEYRTSIATKYNQNKLNEKYHINEIKNSKNNTNNYTSSNNYRTNNNIANNSRYNTNLNNANYKERKTTTYVTNIRNDKDNKLNDSNNTKQYANKSYERIKAPPKYYRNKPLISSNIQNKQNEENKKEKVVIRPVAQKICNIIIKGRKKDEENEEDKYKKKEEDNEDNEENNEEEDEEEGEEEEDDNDNTEEKNKTKSIMQIQRAQSIEQPRDIKTKSQIGLKNNSKNQLKIEKLKNSNFELPKTHTGPIIQMQKAQSFEQPRDIKFNKNKEKEKTKTFEMSQLKDCDVELIGGKNSTFEKEANKKSNQYQANKNKNEISSIPKPNITETNIYKNVDKKADNKIESRKININTTITTKINNNNIDYQKNIPQSKIGIKRSHSNAQPRNENKMEKEKEKDNTNNKATIILHRNNTSYTSKDNNKNGKDKNPEQNKNYVHSIQNSSKKTPNENINKNELNSLRNHTISLSSNNNERPKSSHKYYNVKTEPTPSVNKHITTLITVITPKENLSKDTEKKNDITPVINKYINEDKKKEKEELKLKDKKEPYISRRKNEIKEYNNIKTEIINNDIKMPKTPNTASHNKNENIKK